MTTQASRDEFRFYVYVLFRLDGTPFYVGKGQGRREYSHGVPDPSEKNIHKERTIAKILREGKDIPTVRVIDGVSEAEAFAGEIAFIAAIGRFPHGPLVNQTDGGEGCTGFCFTAAQRAELSRLRKGVLNLGSKHSEESKRKRSEKLKGRAPSPQCIAAVRAANSRKQTAEHVEKKAAALRGRKQPPEQVAAAAAGLRLSYARRGGSPLKGKQQTPEHAAKAKAGFRAAIERRKMKDAVNGES